MTRMRTWPGRLWCVWRHRRRWWKVWRVIKTHHGATWIAYRCRICGREFICPSAKD